MSAEAVLLASVVLSGLAVVLCILILLQVGANAFSHITDFGAATAEHRGGNR